MKILPLLFVFFLVHKSVRTQDPGFSQFYSNPLYLNPALAGTGECSRIMLNYRNQWPTIEKGFTTYSLGMDLYSRSLHGGVGLYVYNDNASGLLNTLHASAIYAYHLNLSHNMQLNAGFEVSYHHQRLDWGKLVFSDMIDRSTGAVIPSNTIENEPANTSLGVADFSAGLVLGIKKMYFFGFSAHHLTQPDLAFYSNNVKSPLSRKYTAHAGAEIKLMQGDYNSDRGSLYLLPGVLYQQQLEARQLNVGVNLELSPVSLGVWYRYNFDNPDGVIFMAGLKQKRFKFGYSYDLSMSKLRDGSGGAHEISLAIFVACDKKRNRPGAIKCPEF